LNDENDVGKMTLLAQQL